MILVVGEILFDELPTGRRPGGAPFNVARHLVRMGLDVRFVSRVGADESGRELVDAVRAAGLPVGLIQSEEDRPTGCVKVHIDDEGIPSYTILPDAAFDYIAFDPLREESARVELICYGSLIQRTEDGRARLQEFLAQQPYGIVHLYDMNLREGCHAKNIIVPSLEHSDVLKINDDELAETGRLIGSSLQDETLVEYLMDTFNIRMVALTRGSAGSVLYAEGERLEQAAGLIGSNEIVDTVGAGDAFTSVLAAGLHQGWAPQDILQLAGGLSERICTIAGAVPSDNAFYKALLEKL
jgi:fructokinase